MLTKYKNKDIAQAIYSELIDKSGSQLSVSLKKVVSFLDRQRLLTQAPKILSELKRIENKSKNIVEATVVTTNILDEKTKSLLRQTLMNKYKAKDILFQEKIDARVLGGIKVEVGDEVIDLTLQNKIKKLQEHLVAKLS